MGFALNHSEFCSVLHTGNLVLEGGGFHPHAARSGRGGGVCPSLLGASPGLVTDCPKRLVIYSVACICYVRNFNCLSLVASTCAHCVINCYFFRALRASNPLTTLSVTVGYCRSFKVTVSTEDVRRSSEKMRCASTVCIRMLGGGGVQVDVARAKSPLRGTLTRQIGGAIGGS